MNRNEAIAYLTQCADDNGDHWYEGRIWSDPDDCPTCKGTNDVGHLATPCSRYGRTSADVAPIAYRYARIIARSDGEPLSRSLLGECMSLVVNDADDPQEAIRKYAIGLAGADVDAMAQGYLEAQLWLQSDLLHPSCDCDHDEASEACHNYMLDENYSMDDIDSDYVESIRDELADVVVEHPLAVRMYLAQRKYDPSQGNVSSYFGHDFYLTREHHGAGFWDRGLGELGRYLTDIAHDAGAADDLYDNGNGVLTR